MKQKKEKKTGKAKERLGRGLAALFSDEGLALQDDDLLAEVKAPKASTAKNGKAEEEGAGGKYAPIDSIELGAHQPRKHFDEGELRNLSTSIKSVGIIQPLIVKEASAASSTIRYQLISGERRLRAAKLAGLRQVPIFIRSANDGKTFQVKLLENIQRSDLNPLEEAHAYDYLLKQEKFRQADLAQELGKSRSHISNMLRLLKAPPKLQQLLAQGQLSFTQARPLLSLSENETALQSLLDTILATGMNVRQIEKEVAAFTYQAKEKGKETGEKASKKYSGLTPSARLSKNHDDIHPFLKTMEEQLHEKFFTKVQIQPIKGRTGKIELEYYDYPQLETLLTQLLSQKPSK